MILTEEQKPLFRRIFMPGVVMALAAGYIYWNLDYRDYDSGGGTPTRFKVMPYLAILFNIVCWGWDWIVQRQWQKLGWLLLVGFIEWALVYELKWGAWNIYGQIFLFGDGVTGFLKSAFNLLLLPFTWYGIARGLLEKNVKTLLSAYLAGLVMTIVMRQLPFTWYDGTLLMRLISEILEFVFSEDLRRMLVSRNLPLLLSMLFYFFMPALTLWLFFFFRNMIVDRQYTWQQIFSTGHYDYAGRWYFAMLYPVFYLLVFLGLGQTHKALAACFNIHGEDTRLMLINLLLWAAVNGAVLYFFFRLLRDLVISRCIRLHRKLDMLYYLSFLPILNIIPFIMYSSSEPGFLQEEDMEYAQTMNSAATETHRFTTGFLICICVIPLLLQLNEGNIEGLGIFVLLINVVRVVMFANWRNTVKMPYYIITVQALQLLIVMTGNEYVRQELLPSALLFFLISLLQVSWLHKIFHPNIDIPYEYQFEAEMQEEEGSSNDIRKPAP
jgi:hypothetical protein